MEHFNTGDVVTWINKDLEGKIVSVLSQELVLVALENGLEIEEHVSELTRSSGGTLYDKGRMQKPEPVDENPDQESNAFSGLPSGIFVLRTKEKGEYYLLNNTTMQVIWSVARVWAGKMQTLHRGELEAESFEKAIQEKKLRIDRDLSLFFQVMFLTYEPAQLRSPLSFHLTTKSRGEKWMEVSPVTGLGLQGMLYRLDAPEAVIFDNMRKSEVVPVSNEHPSSKPPAEVDLHIEKLTRHYRDMDNAQMLRCQLSAFEHAMEQAVAAGYGSITFIHGVGEGVLKSAIIDKARKHPYVQSYEDGPKMRYGNGATVINLKK